MFRTLLPLLLLTTIAATPFAPPAAASPAAAYEGRWNYDYPDSATKINMAALSLAEGAEGPQIGDIVFTATDSEHVTGRTDVGCTWQFRVTGDALTLDPPGQTCHNPVLGAFYTMREWTVRVDGDRETESLTATSHHADRDYEFTLAHGARTRVPEFDPAAAAPFAGAWQYGSPPAKAGATVTLTGNYANRLTAVTDDGCHWTLLARGNTAKLDPPAQTCTRGDSTVTLRFWTIATQGDRQLILMTGTDTTGDFVVSGDLTRH
ncbi:hypothetical protein [Nocardia sp. NPDC127526]|uniref:hypothetical protein n=1 Tax=Nocardia sp. NPDC127526 TaxID=3345393 RepID=UPI00362CC106